MAVTSSSIHPFTQEQSTQHFPISFTDTLFNTVIGSNHTQSLSHSRDQLVDVLIPPINANSLNISQALLQGCETNATKKFPWRIPRIVDNYHLGNNRLLIGFNQVFETSNERATAQNFSHETHANETSYYSSIAKFSTTSSPEPDSLSVEMYVLSETHPFEEMNRDTEFIQVDPQCSLVKPICLFTNDESKKQLSESSRSFAVGILGENHNINTPLPMQTSPVGNISAPSKYFYSTPSHSLFKQKSSFTNVHNLPTASGLINSTDEVLIFV